MARSNGGTPCRESNPDRQGFRHGRYALLMVEDNRSSSAHRNWGGQTDSHRHQRLHRALCCYYTMTTMKWSPWSDSHRRIRVYETRPVAAEARGLGKWRSHVDLHHELPASQTGVQNYLHLESMASVAGLAPARFGLKGRLIELLCIHGQEKWGWFMVDCPHAMNAHVH